MHEKCVEFIVEHCRNICPTWSNCISTAKGFESYTIEDKKDLLFCLKTIERTSKGLDVIEEEIEEEIDTLNLEEI